MNLTRRERIPLVARCISTFTWEQERPETATQQSGQTSASEVRTRCAGATDIFEIEKRGF